MLGHALTFTINLCCGGRDFICKICFETLQFLCYGTLVQHLVKVLHCRDLQIPAVYCLLVYAFIGWVITVGNFCPESNSSC